MKILLVNKYGYLRSGTERYLFNLRRLLETKGHQVELFSMAHPRNRSATYEEYFVPNLDFHSVRLSKMPHLVNRVLWYRAAARRMSRVLDLFRPDLVHLFNIYHHLSPSVLPPIRKRGIPIIQTLNDYKLICPNYLLYTKGRPCLRCRGGAYHNAIIHRCLHGSIRWSTLAASEMLLHRTMAVYERHVSTFAAPSLFVEAKIQEFGIAPDQTTHLPYCVVNDRAAMAETAGGDEGYVLYFGRLSREKGLATLIEAMAQLPHFELRIVGDGTLRDDLERKVANLGLSNVRFINIARGKIFGVLWPVHEFRSCLQSGTKFSGSLSWNPCFCRHRSWHPA